MGGAVRAVTRVVTAPVRAVARSVSKGKWKEQSRSAKDPNRLEYQWDAKRAHDDASERARLASEAGAFTGKTVDYGAQGQAARVASANLARSSAADAQRSAQNKANALRDQIAAEREQRQLAEEAAALRMKRAKETNVAQEAEGVNLTPEQRMDLMREKIKADKASRGTNIFGQSKGIELRPGSAEYIEEMEKRKKLAGQKDSQQSLEDFMRNMKKMRQGEGDRVTPPGGGLVGIGGPGADGSFERPFL